MRAPWPLLGVFALGAASGAGGAILLRPDSAVVPGPGVPANAPVVSVSGAARTPAKADPPSSATGPGGTTPAPASAAGPGTPPQSTESRKPTPEEAEALLRSVVSARDLDAAAGILRRDPFGLANQLTLDGRDTGPLAEAFSRSADPALRRLAINLAHGEPPRVDVVLAAAEDVDPEVRAWALDSLATFAELRKVSADQLAPVVLASLRDPYEEVREDAMDLLPWIGPQGGEEAIRILRSGAHRDTGASPESLLEAALARDPAALLAEPLSGPLAEDVCLAAGDFGEEQRHLVRLLAPHASRLLTALPPGDGSRADLLLGALALAGDEEVVRQVLLDPAQRARFRAAAGGALLREFPPGSWETPIRAWLCDPANDAGARRHLLLDAAMFPKRSETDGGGGFEARVRVLQAVVASTDDAGLLAVAKRMLEECGAR